MYTLGEFREATKDLPDDAELFVDDGDLQFYEVRFHGVLPPVLEHPHVVWLDMGQVWNYERDIDHRIDGWLLH
jgi:hypothetical protein